MSFPDFARRSRHGLTLCAAGLACLASVSGQAQIGDLHAVHAADLDLSTPAGHAEFYRRMKAAVQQRCRPLSNRLMSPAPVGPGNGRATATPPALPSPRAICTQEGLREARVHRNALATRN